MWRWLTRRPSDRTVGTWPKGLQRYHAMGASWGRHDALTDVRFVVFDTETSGLDLRNNRLLSIGAVAVRGEEIEVSDSFECVIAQTDVGGSGAASVHGLVPSDLSGGLDEGIAVADFLAYAGRDVLVAHHARFDCEMVKKALRKYRGTVLRNAWIDTALLAHRLDHGPIEREFEPDKYGLDALLDRFGVDIDDRHTAAGDALATAVLLLVLLKAAHGRGIRTMGQLLRK